MTHPQILQAIKNKWRIKNLYFKNWRNALHSIYVNYKINYTKFSII